VICEQVLRLVRAERGAGGAPLPSAVEQGYRI
jgi:hypothetical protein